MDHDLIEAPLLSCREPTGSRVKATLPGLLARLSAGELTDFPRLRAHQFHPWVMFLTQLAAIALQRAGLNDPRLPEDTWRQLLLRLTAGRHEPWCLVVEDLDQPAFFQPPVPEGGVSKWDTCEWPDDIDILVTAKGHDVKTSLIPGTDVESWIYALATLQTTQGYPGRGYTGIARMNRGYGSRARVGLAPDQSPGRRFVRDVEVLHASWPKLIGRGYRDDGVALVWTERWDGRTSLSTSDLSPHFVEVCWRVRCEPSSDGVRARYTTSEKRRCLPEIETGDVGDPWIPIDRERHALTVGKGGFHYDLLRRLVFETDFEPAASQAFLPGDPDPMLLVAAALARGQGKTEGLHERVLSLSAPVRWQLRRPDLRDALGRRATERVNAAEAIRSKVLYPALKELAPKVEIRHEFDGRVDEVFFDHLFATVEDADEPARLAWERRLREIAWGELQLAIGRFSAPSVRKWRAVSLAERRFDLCLAKNFPDVVGRLDRPAEEVPS